jgi:hypothetical protein
LPTKIFQRNDYESGIIHVIDQISKERISKEMVIEALNHARAAKKIRHARIAADRPEAATSPRRQRVKT